MKVTFSPYRAHGEICAPPSKSYAHRQLICAALSEEFKCGMTRVAAYGGFSGSEKTMIYFVINRFQIGKMKDIVHSLDPRAYITINEVADVFKSNQQSI